MEDEEGRLGVRLLASQATPLVETKLVAPRSHPNMVSRQRLERQLDEFAPAALTLIDAPVGFGKTMLVQSWCAARSSGVAWVSLDAADNDPARLWTSVATAIDRVRSGLGRSTLQRLRVPGAALGRAIEELAQALETYGRPLVIVLDDLHALSSEWSIGSVEYFLGCIPSGVRVVATTRTD